MRVRDHEIERQGLHFWSVAFAAEQLEVGGQQVRRLARLGKLRHVLVGGMTWVRRDDCERYARTRRAWNVLGVRGGLPAADRLGVDRPAARRGGSDA